jgi:selenium metabolism protein YedF
MTVNKDLLLVLKSNGLGDAELDLAEQLLKGFLNILLESGQTPARIICMTSGVFLTTEGSPVLDIMKKFEQAGTEILTCLTCLEYYGRKEKLQVGNQTNMRETVNALLSFSKVISL